MGEGGELERTLVDVTGTGTTVPSCREKRFAKKLCKRHLNSPTVVKVSENKFGQVVEKSFESVLCLFGFVKAAKLRDSSEYSDCIQNVQAKSCLPCQILYIKHREHTLLLNRKRVNKGMKRTNSLPLCLLLFLRDLGHATLLQRKPLLKSTAYLALEC